MNEIMVLERKGLRDNQSWEDPEGNRQALVERSQGAGKNPDRAGLTSAPPPRLSTPCGKSLLGRPAPHRLFLPPLRGLDSAVSPVRMPERTKRRQMGNNVTLLPLPFSL